MKKYMPLEGLRWSRDSGSTLCDTPQNGRSRTGWGGVQAFVSDSQGNIVSSTMSSITNKRIIIKHK